MTHRTSILVTCCAAAALLAGCGGGGSDATPAPGPLEQVPATASQSSASMVDYLKRLTALVPEDREPVDPGDFAPPAPQDEGPEPVA